MKMFGERVENVDFVSRRLLAVEKSFTFDDEGILDVAMIRK